MEKSISVIIPTCDRHEMVKTAINSALSQTIKPLEVIICDNGRKPFYFQSSDKRIHVEHLSPRSGASNARNHGAKIAKGKYLSFLDDDDWWDPTFLEHSYEAIQTQNVKLVYGCIDIWKDGEQAPYRSPTEETLTIANLLRGNQCTGGLNLLIERELFFSIGGFDPRLKASNDRALALDVLITKESIGVAPDAVAVMRYHEGERLRDDPRKKLSFVLKYRHLMPWHEWMIRFIKLWANKYYKPGVYVLNNKRRKSKS